MTLGLCQTHWGPHWATSNRQPGVGLEWPDGVLGRDEVRVGHRRCWQMGCMTRWHRRHSLPPGRLASSPPSGPNTHCIRQGALMPDAQIQSHPTGELTLAVITNNIQEKTEQRSWCPVKLNFAVLCKDLKVNSLHFLVDIWNWANVTLNIWLWLDPVLMSWLEFSPSPDTLLVYLIFWEYQEEDLNFEGHKANTGHIYKKLKYKCLVFSRETEVGFTRTELWSDYTSLHIVYCLLCLKLLMSNETSII